MKTIMNLRQVVQKAFNILLIVLCLMAEVGLSRVSAQNIVVLSGTNVAVSEVSPFQEDVNEPEAPQTQTTVSFLDSSVGVLSHIEGVEDSARTERRLRITSDDDVGFLRTTNSDQELRVVGSEGAGGIDFRDSNKFRGWEDTPHYLLGYVGYVSRDQDNEVLGKLTFDDATTPEVETLNLLNEENLYFEVSMWGSGSNIKVSVEIEDVFGNKDVFFLDDIDTFYNRRQAYKRSVDFLGKNLDVSKILNVNVRIEGHIYGQPGSIALGEGELRFRFNPAISEGNRFYPDADVQTETGVLNLPHELRPAFSLGDGRIGPGQGNHGDWLGITNFSMSYSSYGGNPAGFVAGGLTFDKDSTGEIESVDLSQEEYLYFEASFWNGDLNEEVRVELEDIHGNKEVVVLDGMSEQKQIWSIKTDFFKKVDLSQLLYVIVVADGTLISEGVLSFRFNPSIVGQKGTYELRSSRFSRSYELETEEELNLDKDPRVGVLLPGAMLEEEEGQGIWAGVSHYSLHFENGDELENGYVAGGLTFDDAQTPGVETIDLSRKEHIYVEATLRSRSSGAQEVRMELEDIYGNKQVVVLEGIATYRRGVWEIDTSHFEEIDLSQIRFVIMVIDGIEDWDGELDFRFNPKIVGSPENENGFLPSEDVVVEESILNLPRMLRPAFSLGDTHGFQLNQSHSGDWEQIKKFSMRYVRYEGIWSHLESGYAAGGLVFDSNLTREQEVADLSQEEYLYFEASFVSEELHEEVRVELEDAHGNKEVIVLEGMSEEKKIWKVRSDFFRKVDLSQLLYVIVVAEGSPMSEGVLSFRFNPAVVGQAGSYRVAVPTEYLPSRQLESGEELNVSRESEVGVLSPGGNMSQEHDGRLWEEVTHYTLNFEEGEKLRNSYVAGGLTFDDANTSEVETLDLSQEKSIYFEASYALYAGPQEIRAEIEDIHGNKQAVVLQGINSWERNIWEINADYFQEIDLSQIRFVIMVIDGIRRGNGDLRFRFNPEVM